MYKKDFLKTLTLIYGKSTSDHVINTPSVEWAPTSEEDCVDYKVGTEEVQ